jgi:hypothetical protein
MQVTLAQCSLRLMGGTVKKSGVFGDINGLKRAVRTWKMMKEVVIQDLKEPMKISKESGI